jgi:serine protease inhibitor
MTMLNKVIIFSFCLSTLSYSFAQKNEYEGVNFDDDVQSMNRFGFELFQEMTLTEENVIYSPFSLSVILSMIENGSDGLTSGEITRTIHLDDNREDRNEQYLAMFKYLAEDTLENGVFHWANKIYLAREIERKEAFAEVMQEYYYSELEKIDFSTESVVTDKIQKWMNQTLNHQVDYAMKEAHISRNVELLLANTIYLNGEWAYAFEDEIATDTFTTAQFHEIQIPYAKGINYPVHLKLNPNFPNDSIFVFDFKGSLQLEILYPSVNDTLANVLERINSSYYNEFQEMGITKIDTVYLPLLNVAELSNLKRPLQELGLVSTFGSEADFSELANGLILDDLLHQGELITGVKGVNQTDKNSANLNVSTNVPYQVVRFERPFVFFVRGKRSDIILFMGLVNRF